MGVAALPAFMQSDSRDGKENISQQDMVTPRVTLMQAVSPEVSDGLAENAHFFHTIAEEDLGTEIDDLVILHHSKLYTLWNPRHAGGGIIARASNGKTWDVDIDVELAPYKDQPRKKVKYQAKAGDLVGRDHGLGRWGSMDPENEDSPPAATLSHVLVCASLSRLSMGPFVIQLQRSAEPVAKKLLSKVKIDPAPIYGQIYTMDAVQQSNSSNQEFNQFRFVKNGHVGDETMYNWLKEQHELFKSLGIKFDEAEPEADAGATGGGAAAPEGDGNGGEERY